MASALVWMHVADDDVIDPVGLDARALERRAGRDDAEVGGGEVAQGPDEAAHGRAGAAKDVDG